MALWRLSTHLLGYVGEILVEAYAIISSGTRLTSLRPGADVDHKDLIFDERGRNRNVYAQVKTARAVGPNGVFEFTAVYAVGDLPSSPRFVYILCHLDVTRMALTHVWLVPSADFNRLANQSRYRGRIKLIASPGLGKRGKWYPYLIEPSELGPRLLEIAQKAPAEEPLALPGSLLFIRQ